MDNEIDLSKATLLVNGAHGQYVPRRFIQGLEDLARWGISPDDANVLSCGPEHEHYWETWDDVLSKAACTGTDGKTYHLYQDGDLWAVPVDADEVGQ